MRRLKPLALVVVGLALGFFLSAGRGDKPESEMLKLYGTFVDAVEQVQARYVRPVTRKELVEDALRGMLADLDPYSTYFDEDGWREFQKEVDRSYTGIGVSLSLDEKSGRPVVIAPLVGGPAYAAGLLAGDVVLEIDGKSTEGWDRARTGEALSGLPGTEVKLTVRHRGTTAAETIAVRRAVITQDSVLGDRRKADDTWEFLIDPERKVGYARIVAFVPETPDAMRKALDELTEQGAKALVLDLRDDPGGRLESAVEVADLFLDKGKIVSVKGRDVAERSFEAKPGDSSGALPLVVLINPHTASAAEILAAALQDSGRAVVVGQRSFGKGSVQSVIPLDNGQTRLKLTVATYWRPSGRNIHRFPDAKPEDAWGVSPDAGFEVALTDDQYIARARARQRRDMLSRANQPGAEDAADDPLKTDPQLAKALEVARAKAGGE
jgi:carboxyl-terminal processing protease